MIELLFIRHGATEGNLRRRYIGRTDEPLCGEGIAQVETLRKQGLSIDELFVSPLLRTRQTADILLDNARKYAEAPGDVTVTLTRSSGRCRLTVSNPGPEISKEDLKNIFKRFYRSDTAHTQRGSYGLGLSIAQNIVLRHHGKIWAESKNGRNTFFVELPVK